MFDFVETSWQIPVQSFYNNVGTNFISERTYQRAVTLLTLNKYLFIYVQVR